MKSAGIFLVMSFIGSIGCNVARNSQNSNLLAIQPTAEPLFADLSADAFRDQVQTPKKFVIRGPIQDLMGGTTLDAGKRSTLIFPDGKEAEITLKIRGNTSQLACPFKKLEFAFVKPADSNGTELDGSEEINIGTHCEFNENFFDDIRLGDVRAVAREVLAYRLVELTLQISRRARLVSIEYADTGTATSEIHPAFFLEDTKAMRKRTGTKKDEGTTVALYKKLNVDSATGSFLAEALIANTDWQMGDVFANTINPSQPLYWNFKVVQNPKGEPVAVPYDFDIAGIVAGKPAPDDRGVFHAKYFKNRTPKFRQTTRFMYNFNALFSAEVQEAAIAHFKKLRPAIEIAIHSMGVDDNQIPRDQAGITLAEQQTKEFFDAIDQTRGNYMFGPVEAEVFSNQTLTNRVCSKFFPNLPVIVLSNNPNAKAIRFQVTQDIPNDPLADGTLPCEFAGSSELIKKSKIFWTKKSAIVGVRNPP